MVRSYCQVVKCDGFSAGALLLVCDDKRFFFDVPEGTQRYCTECRLRLARTQGAFLTRTDPDVFLGLPGLLLTLRETERTTKADDAVKSITKAIKAGGTRHHARADEDQIVVSGPESLQTLLAHTEPFLKCPDFYKVRSVAEAAAEEEEEEGAEPTDADGAEGAEVYAAADGSLRIFAHCAAGAVSYRIEVAAQPGRFLAAKAEELGVKGKKRSLLKGGEAVESDVYPGLVVRPEQVLGEGVPPARVLVAAAPLTTALGAFFRHRREGDQEAAVKAVYHLTRPAEQTAEYEAGYLSFFAAAVGGVPSPPPTEVVRNFFHAPPTHTVFHSSALQHDRLHAIAPTLFPAENLAWGVIDGQQQQQQHPSSAPSSAHPDSSSSSAHRAGRDTLRELHTVAVSGSAADPQQAPSDKKLRKQQGKPALQPRGPVEPDAAEGGGGRPPLDLAKGREEWPDELRAEDLPAPAKTATATATATGPEVTMLGTGGMMPSKYRNVTAMLVDLRDQGYILLDCGEGTLGQIRRCKDLTDVLRRLRIVWVSHMHADHHAGLAAVLRARARLHPDLPPVAVVGPAALREYLAFFNTVTPLCHTYAACSDDEAARVEVAGVVLRSVRVDHCADSWGCVLEGVGSGGRPWKIVNSGDTRPCRSLVEAGAGCDLLIHEATFEDDKLEDAEGKKHSTVGEALRAAEQMRARQAVLTHFSQRYPKVPPPIEGGAGASSAALAFDHMALTTTSAEELGAMNRRLRVLEGYYAARDEEKRREAQIKCDELTSKAEVMEQPPPPPPPILFKNKYTSPPHPTHTGTQARTCSSSREEEREGEGRTRCRIRRSRSRSRHRFPTGGRRGAGYQKAAKGVATLFVRGTGGGRNTGERGRREGAGRRWCGRWVRGGGWGGVEGRTAVRSPPPPPTHPPPLIKTIQLRVVHHFFSACLLLLLLLLLHSSLSVLFILTTFLHIPFRKSFLSLPLPF